MFQTLFTTTYQLIINPKLKYIHLNINEQGQLVVKAPHNSQYQIKQLLLNKKDWIEKAQKKFRQKKGKVPTFESDNEELYYLGISYPLTLIPHHKSKNSFQYIEEYEFIIKYLKKEPELFLKQINNFYKEKAKKFLPPLIEEQAKIMSLYPTAISFRKTKRQWGSCSSKNHLSFNTGLMKLPLDVIQYVIIHELTHIKHKHHQKAFWEEVERYSPNYKKLEQELKEYLT